MNDIEILSELLIFSAYEDTKILSILEIIYGKAKEIAKIFEAIEMSL